jgi:hypothetical protein
MKVIVLVRRNDAGSFVGIAYVRRCVLQGPVGQAAALYAGVPNQRSTSESVPIFFRVRTVPTYGHLKPVSTAIALSLARQSSASFLARALY